VDEYQNHVNCVHVPPTKGGIVFTFVFQAFLFNLKHELPNGKQYNESYRTHGRRKDFSKGGQRW